MDEITNDTRKTGAIGEKIAVKYLSSKGYDVIEQNYRKKWGEIDVIARKGKVVHFVEVKTLSYETRAALEWAVTHETWRPEELVHEFKLHQIKKAAETWISEHSFQGECQIDVIAVRIVPRETFSTVNFIEKVIIDD